jgi:hypothetical protein
MKPGITGASFLGRFTHSWAGRNNFIISSVTPQSQPAPAPIRVKPSFGGWAFAVIAHEGPVEIAFIGVRE